MAKRKPIGKSSNKESAKKKYWQTHTVWLNKINLICFETTRTDNDVRTRDNHVIPHDRKPDTKLLNSPAVQDHVVAHELTFTAIHHIKYKSKPLWLCEGLEGQSRERTCQTLSPVTSRNAVKAQPLWRVNGWAEALLPEHFVWESWLAIALPKKPTHTHTSSSQHDRCVRSFKAVA